MLKVSQTRSQSICLSLHWMLQLEACQLSLEYVHLLSEQLVGGKCVGKE